MTGAETNKAVRPFVNLDDAWSDGVIESALREIGLQPKRKGPAWVFSCPSCGKPEAFCYPPTDDKPPVVCCGRVKKCNYRKELYNHLLDWLGGHVAVFDKLAEWGAPTSDAPQDRREAPKPEPETIEPSPRDEALERVWAAGMDVTEFDAAVRLLENKQCNPGRVSEHNLARVVVGPLEGVWKAHGPRLAVRRFNSRGELCGLSSRHLDPDATKFRHYTRGRGGLMGGPLEEVFLDGLGRGKWMTDESKRVVIVEGLTDWINATLRNLADEFFVPCFGYSSGSDRELRAIPWPGGVSAYVRMDPDDAGDRHREKIFAALAECGVATRTRVKKEDSNGHK